MSPDSLRMELLFDEFLGLCLQASEALHLGLTRTEVFRLGKDLAFEMLRPLTLSLTLPAPTLSLCREVLCKVFLQIPFF